MKKNEPKDIVFLLDRSGSMGGMESDTIGGYNSYIEKLKNENALVTTVLFDNDYEILTDRVDISKVKKLNKKTYYVRGCTALLDAIGKTIRYIDSKTNHKVLFIITTDGLENASVEFNSSQIKELIQGHKNYEFIYLGADIDSYSEAASIGIKRENTSNYVKSKRGTAKMFAAMERVSADFMADKALPDDWKDGLED